MSGVSNLAAGTWQDAAAMVGQTLARLAGPDPVNESDIRRKLEVIGWDCPLHYDAACARQHGYRTIVSPISMTRTWAIQSYWRPGQPRIGSELMSTPLPATLVPGRGDTLIATGVRTEYLEPVYPGDRITGTAVLASLQEKRTSIGPGAFFVVETTYENQHGQTVAVEQATLFRFFSRPRADSAAGEGFRAARPSPAAPAGESLPPFSVALTLQRLVMEAGANRDFAPIHFDRTAARETGAPDVYVNSTLVETLLEATIRSWAGLSARITVLQYAMNDFTTLGGTVSAAGVVRPRGPGGTVELHLWIDSARGRTVEGQATIAFPLETEA
jgi:acyl dehydratase